MFSFFRRKYVVIGTIAVCLAFGGYYVVSTYFVSSEKVEYKTPEEKDEYVRFTLEGFDSIKERYWAKLEEPAFASHFQLSLQKALNSAIPPTLNTKDRAGVSQMISMAVENATSTEAKKALVLNVLNVALYNLEPIGRNGLLSKTQETAFRQDVANVDTEKDLYADLGLSKGASDDEIKIAYENKAKELEADSSPEAKVELEKISYAKKVLVNPNTKDLYDEAKIEPTASTNIFGKTLYIKIDRISPTTLIEFGRTVYGATTTPGLNSMIIDLRGNLGGALDFAQHFLGLFLGQNQYAFDFFHQGEYTAQRTLQPHFPELDRYKEIAVLTDNMTQSTAEVTSSAFKRFKLGTVVGTATRGWGTVENTFPLKTIIDPKESYLLLLVHSITLREDGEPVEGRGIDPNVDTTKSGWKKNLPKYFNSPEFIKNIENVVDNPPK